MFQDFPGGPVVKSPLANAETQVRSLVQEDPTCLGRLSLCATASEALEP